MFIKRHADGLSINELDTNLNNNNKKLIDSNSTNMIKTKIRNSNTPNLDIKENNVNKNEVKLIKNHNFNSELYNKGLSGLTDIPMSVNHLIDSNFNFNNV